MQVSCDCGKQAVLRTVKKETINKGRQFWTCPGSFEEKCKFFQWHEQDLSPAVGPNMSFVTDVPQISAGDVVVDHNQNPDLANCIEAKLAKCVTELTRANEEIGSKKRKIESLERSNKKLKNKQEEQQVMVSRLEAEKKELKERLSVLERQKNHAESLETQNTTLLQSIAELSADLKVYETRQNYDLSLCRICMTHALNMIIYPCKHASFCKTCVDTLMKTDATCPLCRKKIVYSHEIFIQ